MRESVVLTIIGEDRPGLVELISRTAADHGANWEESRMARLGGRFAGILRLSVGADRAGALVEALRGLEGNGLRAVVDRSPTAPARPGYRPLHLELIGSDRPGIVHEIARALASRHVNVEEIATECVPAPLSGGTLFRASARVVIPPSVPVADLREALEAIAEDLHVELTLEEASDAEDRGSGPVRRS